MRLKNILFLSLLFQSAVFSEKYGPYDLAFPSAVSAGTASLGVGQENSSSNLYTNPSLLSNENKSILDGGLSVSTNQNKYNALRPTSLGFYVPINATSGVGLTGKQSFYQNFPSGYDSMSNYTYSFFGSFKLNDNWNASIGIGPSVVYRGGYQSSYSISPQASLSYKKEKHLVGAFFQSTGKFRLEGYRSADSLRERIPEFFAIGYSYDLGQTKIYTEIRKIFWEYSSFKLNGNNSKPPLDRGIGAEFKYSLGFNHSISDTNFQIRSGIELGGFYNEKGQNKRSVGLAIGGSWKVYQSKEEDSFLIHFAIVNYSIFSKSGGRQPETQFYFSGSYLY